MPKHHPVGDETGKGVRQHLRERESHLPSPPPSPTDTLTPPPPPLLPLEESLLKWGGGGGSAEREKKLWLAKYFAKFQPDNEESVEEEKENRARAGEV